MPLFLNVKTETWRVRGEYALVLNGLVLGARSKTVKGSFVVPRCLSLMNATNAVLAQCRYIFTNILC